MNLNIQTSYSSYPELLQTLDSPIIPTCEKMNLNKLDLKLEAVDLPIFLKFLEFSYSLYQKIDQELAKILSFPDAKFEICYADLNFNPAVFDFQFNTNLKDIITGNFIKNIFPGNNVRHSVNKSNCFLIREWTPTSASARGQKIITLYNSYYATNTIKKFSPFEQNLESNITEAVLKHVLK